MKRFHTLLCFQLLGLAAYSQLDLTKSDSLSNELYTLASETPDTLGFEPDYDCIYPIEYPPSTKNCVGINLFDKKKECLNSEIKKLIEKEAKIPMQLRDSPFTAIVYVSFVVDENAKVNHPEIRRSSTYYLSESIKPLAYLLDDEAIRVVSTLKFVEPPMLNSKPTRMQFTVPIKYANPGK